MPGEGNINQRCCVPIDAVQFGHHFFINCWDNNPLQVVSFGMNDIINPDSGPVAKDFTLPISRHHGAESRYCITRRECALPPQGSRGTDMNCSSEEPDGSAAGMESRPRPRANAATLPRAARCATTVVALALDAGGANRGAAHFSYACNPLSGDPRGSALMQPWDLRRYPAMLARVSQGKGDRVWPRSHAERPPVHALAGTRGRNRASRGRAPGR